MSAMFASDKSQKNGGNQLQMKHRDNRRLYFRIPLSKKIPVSVRMNGLLTSWSDEDCQLVNLSAGGANIITSLNLPPSHPDITIVLPLTLLHMEHTFEAKIVWKNEIRSLFQYGLQWFNMDPARREQLVRELMQMQLMQMQMKLKKKGF